MRRAMRVAGGLLVVGALVAAGQTPVTVAAAHDGHGSQGESSMAELPAGFWDTKAIGNLSEPTGVAFAPDGTAFIALKTGLIKSFDYDAGTGEYESFATHTDFADLSTNVNNYWDRGLTGITLDPQFGTAGHNYVYVNYAYNRDPRDNPPVVPKWGDPAEQYDECPSPAAPPSTTGCLVMARVSRLTAVQGPDGWVMQGSELPLLSGTCFQFPSHASGDVRIAPDGFLYASFGDGASFDFEDYGQVNNPCPGDPPDEGGSLRSQDIRTDADPVDVGGAIVRMHPSTGLAPDGSNDHAKRMVTYGQRNPWRFTFRPGTTELWSADVGGSAWEEINRTETLGMSAPVNLGWPCYEGAPSGSTRNAGWDALDKPICESLYAAGADSVAAPYFAYPTRGAKLTPEEDCHSTTSSVSGVAFVPASSSYPAEYQGSLFFSDYARGCIWRLGKKANGDPDPATIIPFVQAAETPVDLVVGPGGDLFYVDYGLDEAGVPVPGEGAVRRVTYGAGPPVAAISADKTYGPLPLTVQFSAAGSTDPQGGTLTYTWDLDGDGAYDDASGLTASRTYTAAVNVLVSVRAVSSVSGRAGYASITVFPGNDPPAITSITPNPAPAWAVGEVIGFGATATDPQDGALGDASFTWSLTVAHCPSQCHTHNIQKWQHQRTGSLVAPDHEYPSHLLLTVFVTDARSMTVRHTIRMDPRAVDITFATSKPKLELTAAGVQGTAPLTKRFIVGSRFIVSAPATQSRKGVNYAFQGWSDGGARSHEVVAPEQTHRLEARYAATEVRLRVKTKPGKLKVRIGGKWRKSGWEKFFATGKRVRVAAPKHQSRKGELWTFVRWSDGGERVHRVKLGQKAVTLKAVYVRRR